MEDPLKKIYKKAFNTYTQPVDSLEFDKLQLVLQKHNFMRFHAFQFNVYYASMIASFFMLSIGTTSHYVYNFVLNKPEVEIPIAAISTSKTILEKSIKPNKILTIENKEAKSKSEAYNGIKRDNSTAEQVNSILLDSNKMITKELEITASPISENIHPLGQPISEPIKIHIKKQKVVIELQDTIHKFDTIKTKSSFWQRKK